MVSAFLLILLAVLGGVISVPAEELECVMNFDCNNDPKTLFLIDGSTGIMSLALKHTTTLTCHHI